jgi:hypothetical protein
MRAIVILLLCLAIPVDARAQGVPRQSGALAYRWVRDTLSGAKLPRLTDVRTPQAQAVNRQLDSISAELRCEEAVDHSDHKTEHWSLSKAEYAAHGVFSVYIRFGGFCGGPNPINGINLSTTFDLRTAKPVLFRDLFADFDRDAQGIVRAIFAQQTAAADTLPPSWFEQLDDYPDDFCLQFYTTESLVETYFSYTFSDSGLVVEPEFSQVVRACQEPMVAPYERLLPFAEPGGILARVAAARSSTAARSTPNPESP